MPELVRVGASAIERSKVAARGDVTEFLVFRMAESLFGVALAKIRQIIVPPPLTLVPRAPATVLGVCSVRGVLVTVFDVRQRLSISSPAEEERKSRVLLADIDGEVVGVLVDEVRHVIRVVHGDIEDARAVLGGDVGDHVVGIARPGGEFVSLLAVEALARL
jgi:chemotaxis signal transduction protein